MLLEKNGSHFSKWPPGESYVVHKWSLCENKTSSCHAWGIILKRIKFPKRWHHTKLSVLWFMLGIFTINLIFKPFFQKHDLHNNTYFSIFHKSSIDIFLNFLKNCSYIWLTLTRNFKCISFHEQKLQYSKVTTLKVNETNFLVSLCRHFSSCTWLMHAIRTFCLLRQCTLLLFDCYMFAA